MDKYTDITFNDKLIRGGRQQHYWDLEPNHTQRGERRKAAGEDRFSEALRGQRYMQDILNEYKLKGFEFGHYMEQDSREDNVISCKKSLGQLSVIIGSKNLGIDANIGIAFGARGRGGKAAAHYEPYENMINITKRYIGAMAHEYGHALDYSLGAYIDQNEEYTALSGGESTAAVLEKNTGGQLRCQVNKIVDFVKQSDSYTRMRKEEQFAGEYWARRTEVFARLYEQYICYKLMKAGKQNLYLTKEWGYYTKGLPYLLEVDFLTILPEVEKLNRLIGDCLNDRLTIRRMPYPLNKERAAATKKATAKTSTAKKTAKAKPTAKRTAKRTAKSATKSDFLTQADKTLKRLGVPEKENKVTKAAFEREAKKRKKSKSKK